MKNGSGEFKHRRQVDGGALGVGCVWWKFCSPPRPWGDERAKLDWRILLRFVSPRCAGSGEHRWLEFHELTPEATTCRHAARATKRATDSEQRRRCKASGRNDLTTTVPPNRRYTRSDKWLAHCPRSRFGLVSICRSSNLLNLGDFHQATPTLPLVCFAHWGGRFWCVAWGCLRC